MEFNGAVAGSVFVNLIALLYGIGMLYSMRTLFWKRVRGKITKSELHSYEDEETMYEPKVEYEYVYKAHSYCGNQIGFAVGATNFKFAANDLLSQFTKDLEVTVYVNPYRPSKAVLVPGIRAGNILFLLVFIFVAYVWVPVGWTMWNYLSAL